MKTRLLMLIVVLLLGTGAFAEEDNGDAILGKWVTEEGKGHVEIYKEGGKYSGKIVWLKEPNYPEGDPEAGKPRHDLNNPDASKRDQPIIGLVVLRDFTYTGDKTWKKGTIYDPENGKTYKCTITLAGDGSLKVRGFIGVSLIGRTSVWTRAK
ncbi:MAG: hypothetical protein BWX80_01074 [Candidatus Hydrogenedentes bacterium ADurb.Bin101]|jgi:uncharacterized protein (DUF2147 family)|nr:MAG: hypothetical protein BWX80_01074 [Candidatus Hydrogenedentes bacterium ADurb.Bin101]HOC70569.1 DUF2147 domain-containing protein [Candidatus Hydrogenedentota bacterium]